MSEQLNQLVRNTREIERQKYREELRIRAALAAMQGLLHAGYNVLEQSLMSQSFDYADAFIEELERRG